MNENKSKNYKEIFEERFSYKLIKENPLVATEAVGYLEALEQFLPADRWIEEYKAKILMALVTRVIGGDNND